MSSTSDLERALGIGEDENQEEEYQKSFDVLPTPEKSSNLPIVNDTELDQIKNDDYKYARDTMTYLIQQGNEALVGLLNLANEAPHPRTYEVISSMIRTVSETTKNLIDLNESVNPKKSEGSQQKADVINNTQIITTSQDKVLEMLKRAERENIIDGSTEE